MDLFTVDTIGEQNLLDKVEYDNTEVLYSNSKSVNDQNTDDEEEDTKAVEKNYDYHNEEDDEDYDYGGIPPPPVDIISILKKPALFNKPLYDNDECSLNQKDEESDLDAFCKAMGWTNINGVLPVKPDKKPKRQWQTEEFDLTDVHKDLTKTNVEKEMSTNVLKGIQAKREVKVLSEREAHRQRKAEASKTKGKDWFNIPATEVTDELRQDLEVIQMRSVLNPTHFYKKNDLKTLPKYFQVGTVLPSPLDKYNDRGERVSKKKSLVDELLEDAEFQRYNKRKYQEVLAEKRNTGFKKAYKKMKKLKKKS
ncbi:deoxynucleotidyltransferase terminal-interacting protein 2 [Contarinia nasturtii]|uniref:deoxynucleotidyltransferase terminal-interacting protein 2 n=1 Tax=Contarinia nasturtii TaxID=265458 RepID=UPI0012D37CC9|nr:deoxynucleotidyltransferase terminal-interacting protein 2 [Contarinia nasturtii]